MSDEKFAIKSIERYQNPVKYASYYYNLKNVQTKLKTTSYLTSKDENEKKLNKALESWKEYTPFTELDEKGEKYMFHVKRYQSMEEILGKTLQQDQFSPDWGFLPFKKIDANTSNMTDKEDEEDERNAKDDNCMNLGNNALYFTVNPTEKVL